MLSTMQTCRHLCVDYEGQSLGSELVEIAGLGINAVLEEGEAT